MQKVLILVLSLALLLSGCTWMDGEYHSVKPHASDGNKLSDDVITVSDSIELRDALVEMVTTGRQQSTIYISGFSLDDVDQYMSMAILYVQQNSAVGSYAVDKITYESGTSGGKPRRCRSCRTCQSSGCRHRHG